MNSEIAALSQHQDPASPNAASVNKKIALALAVQIAKIGGNPLDAIKSGTFAPGTLADPTAKGNTCDDANDPVGCIFTQNLLFPDVTADEINAAYAIDIRSMLIQGLLALVLGDPLEMLQVLPQDKLRPRAQRLKPTSMVVVLHLS